ncbi:cysteine sulfinic acid decarboxylase isoform X2 [Paralichthys olivaceus]|uniref:cysteine sulfinic acid decarboxylase isoform X2 n=1 Tax=Paralichthys olivaceus TaxID=8255 RepID=UPI00097E15C1|nr:PREDICTED: cysteine sulfinic acid decarboxylase isoform X2 [Paralichthys olivaceus]
MLSIKESAACVAPLRVFLVRGRNSYSKSGYIHILSSLCCTFTSSHITLMNLTWDKGSPPPSFSSLCTSPLWPFAVLGSERINEGTDAQQLLKSVNMSETSPHSSVKQTQKPDNLHDLTEPLIDHTEGQLFLNETFKIIIEEVLGKGTDVGEKVCEWKEPEQLALLLDLELRATGEPQHRLLQRVKDVAKYSVKTSHPRFFNQQFAGVDYHSLAGRFLTESLNTNLFTYEVAPVFVLMETEVLRGLRQLVGWTEGDGIFCPGGSTSNMYAMNLARYRLFPEVKTQGLWGLPRLTVFTSQESHYSVKKGAGFLGLGTDNVILVKVDDGGRMIPSDLDEKITLTKSQGAVPFLVSCTAGTTVQGAFDPLDHIADVCEKHKLWLHVDAAWGGSVLFSKQHRHLMKGVDRANSVAWNPHKMLVAGLQCSALLLKDTTNLLKQCHCASATYLFQQDKFYDVNLDIGDKSLQCSRKVDCLKLWLMWKAVGSNGLAERVDKAFFHVRYLVEQMKKREGFHLLGQPEFVNVCFWYIPPSLRGKEGDSDYQDRLAKVAPVIKERMVKQGTMMVGYQPLANRVNFFRVIIFSPLISQRDMDFFLDEIERLGNDL